MEELGDLEALRVGFGRYRRSFREALRTAHGVWAVREGILLAVRDGGGRVGIGEVAPLPEFGSETIAEAEEFLAGLKGRLEDWRSVPDDLPCCQFAVEMAIANLSRQNHFGSRSNSSDQTDLHPTASIAEVLNSGWGVLEQWQTRYAAGARTFKWKIGVLDLAEELEIFSQLCQALPSTVKLRLDANAGLTVEAAQQWLQQCDRWNQHAASTPNCTDRAGAQIEYLEQPLPVNQFDALLQLSQQAQTPIALDESIATYQQLEACYDQGWRGIFVVKPAIAGYPSRFRQWFKTHPVSVVFSSVFETEIAWQQGLQFGQELSIDRAFGFGTQRYFYPETGIGSTAIGSTAIGSTGSTAIGSTAIGSNSNHQSAQSPTSKSTLNPPIAIIAQTAEETIVQVLAAIVSKTPVFLANPQWGKQEEQQLTECIQSYDRDYYPGMIMIPTGGSSGTLKFAAHRWDTLQASVLGTQDFWQQHLSSQCLSSLCVLPLHHVSGWMQWMRSHLTGGEFVQWDWKRLEAGDWPALDFSDYFLSLVPTQLQRLLDRPDSIPVLQTFRAILLGGAPAWSDLLDRAHQANLPIALTYGMTETASQITLLPPTEFLGGTIAAGLPLSHGQIDIRDANGQPCPPHTIGQLHITAASIALNFPQPFQPDDLGYWDDRGFLQIVGRQSDKIITGGENVFPAEVEAAIRATGQVQDVCVVGSPDPVWGQRIIALYVPQFPDTEPPTTLAIAAYKVPKAWISCDQLPRNTQGKLDRTWIEARIKLWLNSGGSTRP